MEKMLDTKLSMYRSLFIVFQLKNNAKIKGILESRKPFNYI